MLKLALIALGAVTALLLALALWPQGERRVPESRIQLSDTAVTLYPRADPAAVWRFDAPEVAYDPESRETTLYRITDGARLEDGETDFTLHSEEITIDSEDNLRGDALTARLAAEETDLAMSAKFGRQVFINQAAGHFEIPHLELSDAYGDGTYENMRISFDLQEFSAGGPGTVGYSAFEIGERDDEGGDTAEETTEETTEETGSPEEQP